MLYMKYGKGAYVFSAYDWFRELPAGVPGAYRVFANMLSAAKTQWHPQSDDPRPLDDEPPPILGTWRRVYLRPASNWPA